MRFPPRPFAPTIRRGAGGQPVGLLVAVLLLGCAAVPVAAGGTPSVPSVVSGAKVPSTPVGLSSSPARDTLTAASIRYTLRYGAALPPAPAPRDRWLGRDKVQHVVFSGLWTLSTQYVLVNKADWSEDDALPASIASGATIGILKELYDASRITGRASGKDLVADAVGIGLAVGVITL